MTAQFYVCGRACACTYGCTKRTALRSNGMNSTPVDIGPKRMAGDFAKVAREEARSRSRVQQLEGSWFVSVATLAVSLGMLFLDFY
jgi:hypothetical protein